MVYWCVGKFNISIGMYILHNQTCACYEKFTCPQSM
jgi:hypothetical protein